MYMYLSQELSTGGEGQTKRLRVVLQDVLDGVVKLCVDGLHGEEVVTSQAAYKLSQDTLPMPGAAAQALLLSPFVVEKKKSVLMTRSISTGQKAITSTNGQILLIEDHQLSPAPSTGSPLTTEPDDKLHPIADLDGTESID